MIQKIKNRISITLYNTPLNIPENVLDYCINFLSYKDGGNMKYIVSTSLNQYLNCRIGVLKLNGIPVCWCLQERNTYIHVYTAKKHRKKGFAKKLLQKFIHGFEIKMPFFYKDFYTNCKKDDSYIGELIQHG